MNNNTTTNQKGLRTPQKGTSKKPHTGKRPSIPQPSCGETRGTNPHLLAELYQLSARKTPQSHTTTAKPHTALIKFEDGYSIAFDSVVMDLALCMSQCLSDVPHKKRDTAYIQALLKDYVAVGYDLDGTVRVSLDTVVAILQDNYEGSSLERMFHLLFVVNEQN